MDGKNPTHLTQKVIHASFYSIDTIKHFISEEVLQGKDSMEIFCIHVGVDVLRNAYQKGSFWSVLTYGGVCMYVVVVVEAWRLELTRRSP